MKIGWCPPLLLALVVTPLAGACSSASPAGDEGSPRALCPPKARTATLPTAGSALTAVASFGANPAGLKMYVHGPASGKATAVVVALHGCTQSAAAYVNAGWNATADAAGFVVVYPEQTTANNSSQCFRWWDAAHITRGQGEARSIASMVEHAKATYGASTAFVTGLSAGAAMTAVMLATYPDLFEAGAIMAGLPYACATSQSDAYTCMNPGKDKSQAAWGALVPKLGAATAPRVSIWHGAADYTVRPANLVQLVRQWTSVNGLPDKATATTTVGKGTHDEYRDASGAVRVESWSITGMSHGVSVNPSAGCGTAAAYVIDEGLCSTQKAAEFFGLVAPSAPAPGPQPGPAAGGAAGVSPAGGGSVAAESDCDP